MDYYSKYSYSELQIMPPNKRILCANIKPKTSCLLTLPKTAAVKEFLIIKHNYEMEAKLFSEVSMLSPHIVTYYNHIKYDDKFFIYMEYCRNGSTSHSIKSLIDKGLSWSHPFLIKQFSNLASALNILLENKISHRDLKPDNIFVTQDWDFKLGDFGISKRHGIRQNETHSVVGTLLYMSPILKHEYHDKKSSSEIVNLEKEDV